MTAHAVPVIKAIKRDNSHMKRLLLAAVAATALLSGTANATPLLSIQVFDGSTLIASSLNVVGGVDNAINNVFDSNFSSISVSALGIPVLPSPDLSSTTINAKTNGGAATLTVLISQTGVTVPDPTKLLSTFTFNALLGTNSSAVMSNWISDSNVAFALTTQIGLAALNPTVSSAGPFMSDLTPTLFSETEKYVITFGAGHGVQSTSLTAQIVDAPEPFSAAMLGVGLLGLAMVHRSKKAV
jgi:hypothetical protein